MKTYEYKFKILNINVTEACVSVNYIPTKESLVAIQTRVPLVKTDTGEFDDIINTIKTFAPHSMWEAHEYLVENYDTLLYTTELVTIENA